MLPGNVRTFGWLALATRHRLHIRPKTSLRHQVCGSFRSLVAMVITKVFEHFTLKKLREKKLEDLSTCFWWLYASVQHSLPHTDLVPLLDQFADSLGLY